MTPMWAVSVGMVVHRALLRLAWSFAPAHLQVMDLAFGSAKTWSMDAAIRLGVFELLTAPGRTSAEVAERLGTCPDGTHRFLRALATIGVLELRRGRFVNGPAGEACRDPRGVGAFVRYFATASNARAWASVDHSVRTGSSAFVHVHGRSVWEHFDAHPEELVAFADAMAFLTAADAASVARAWPFAQHPDVVDVGCGGGVLAGELLARNPGSRVTLVDRPAALAHARAHLERRGLADRADLVPGDFFGALPAGHAVYLLKNILHDWDDARSAQILAGVREACATGARLLVIEEDQERDALGPTAIADLQMLVVCDGGRERSEGELATLMAGAGFRFVRSHPTASRLRVFEGLAC